jgi:hypothetical protein
MLMVVPLAGVDQDPGAPTINAQNINDGSLGPWGGGSGPHLGDDGDSGAASINAKNVNGGPQGP